MSQRKTFAMLTACLLLLCACKQNPTQEALYQPLEMHFAQYGFVCEWHGVAQDRSVPIYNASVWRSLNLGGEEVLVYFDESNRADYQADGVERDGYSFVGHFGLRFVLVYEGQDVKVLEALNAME